MHNTGMPAFRFPFAIPNYSRWGYIQSQQLIEEAPLQKYRRPPNQNISEEENSDDHEVTIWQEEDLRWAASCFRNQPASLPPVDSKTRTPLTKIF
jgi:hypothetical protein